MNEEMTREQAIEELSILLNKWQDSITGDALDMAITALENELKVDNFIKTIPDINIGSNIQGIPCEFVFLALMKMLGNISSMPEQKPCKDTISRQAAIDAFSMFAEYESNRTNAEWVDRIRVVLSSLPPVQPIRPRGHWINKEVTDEYGVVGNCSECKERRIIDNFCPSCGADMRE